MRAPRVYDFEIPSGLAAAFAAEDAARRGRVHVGDLAREAPTPMPVGAGDFGGVRSLPRQPASLGSMLEAEIAGRAARHAGAGAPAAGGPAPTRAQPVAPQRAVAARPERAVPAAPERAEVARAGPGAEPAPQQPAESGGAPQAGDAAPAPAPRVSSRPAHDATVSRRPNRMSDMLAQLQRQSDALGRVAVQQAMQAQRPASLSEAFRAMAQGITTGQGTQAAFDRMRAQDISRGDMLRQAMSGQLNRSLKLMEATQNLAAQGREDAKLALEFAGGDPRVLGAMQDIAAESGTDFDPADPVGMAGLVQQAYQRTGITPPQEVEAKLAQLEMRSEQALTAQRTASAQASQALAERRRAEGPDVGTLHRVTMPGGETRYLGDKQRGFREIVNQPGVSVQKVGAGRRFNAPQPYVDSETGEYLGEGVTDSFSGQTFLRTESGMKPLPPNARPRTTTGLDRSLLDQKQFLELAEEVQQDAQGIRALREYAQNVESGTQGLSLLADQLVAAMTTLAGGDLDDQRFANAIQSGQLQGLVGRFRKEVVGGGILSDQDIERVLRRLGGEPGALRNKQVAMQLLQEVLRDKVERYNRNAQQYNYQISNVERGVDEEMPLVDPNLPVVGGGTAATTGDEADALVDKYLGGGDGDAR